MKLQVVQFELRLALKAQWKCSKTSPLGDNDDIGLLMEMQKPFFNQFLVAL